MKEKKILEIWSKIRCAALLIGLNLVWFIPCAIKYYEEYIVGGM